jgi:ABC-type transporter Mla subunit MlaD
MRWRFEVGSPVTMSGVRIGEVADIRFDSRTYKAVVSMRIGPSLRALTQPVRDAEAGNQTLS